MFIDDYTFSVKVYILPYILPIIHIALLGSIYSTVALAAERYITICHPFMRYRCALKKKYWVSQESLFELFSILHIITGHTTVAQLLFFPWYCSHFCTLFPNSLSSGSPGNLWETPLKRAPAMKALLWKFPSWRPRPCARIKPTFACISSV